jgi:Flp pilus assembly protein TadG
MPLVRRSSVSPRSLQSQRGAVSVEIALASVLFCATLLAVFDFGRMYYYQSRLKHAVSQATRFATTGNTLEDPDNPGITLSRVDSILLMIRQLSGFAELPSEDVTIVAISSGGTETPGAGGPGDVVTVTVQYRVDILTPYLAPLFDQGQYHFSATTSFRNEEFPEDSAALDDVGRALA